MFGLSATSALTISDTYTVPQGVVTQALIGVQGVTALGTANGSAQIILYLTGGVQATATLGQFSDLFLMGKHRYMYTLGPGAVTASLGSPTTVVKGGFSIITGVESVGSIGNVIAQGTFVSTYGVAAEALLGEAEGDKFDYWKKIKPDGPNSWTEIVVPKPTL